MPRSICKNPNIEIDEEEFSYSGVQRHRVVRLTGTLQLRLNVKRDTSVPSFTMLHWGHGTRDLRIPATDGGHIMALSLGGVDIPENVVPMYSGFNRHEAWREKEREILEYRSSHSGSFRMCVQIAYQDPSSGGDPRIPGAFTVWLEDLSGKAMTDRELVTMTKDAPERIEVTGPNAELVAKAQSIVDAGWRMESELEKGSVPPKLPGFGNARPYAVLDYLDFHRQIAPTNFGNGYSFTPQQRESILFVNRVRNGGWLFSDDTSENASPLSLYGDAGAEIDHIVPKSQTGSNCYSNARVISSMLNKGKGTKPL